jgi:hypothetical protein
VLPLVLTLALAAPAAASPTPGAVPPAATAHGGPPAPLRIERVMVVPRAAAPSSGAPMAAQEHGQPYEPIARRVNPYTPLPATGMNPFSVFSESRSPGSPRGRRGESRGPGEHRVLPLPHASSQPQAGLMLGGSVNYSYRRPGQEFNRAYVQAWSRVSTRLVEDHNLNARLRDLTNHNEVFQFGAIVIKDPVFPFFGINNHENLGGTELSGPYNWVHMSNYGGWFSYEHPLWQLQRPGRAPGVLRHYSGAFYYVDVIRAQTDSRLAAEAPQRAGMERRGVVRLGLSWDSRDNDWSPGRGSLIDLTVDVAGHYTGSTSNWGRLHLSARNYIPLGMPELVLATRATIDALWGAPPLMALGDLGGVTPMDAYGGAFVGRGFARRRFIGNVKALATAELRFTPLERKVGRHTAGLGFELFAEVGAVGMQFVDLHKHILPSGGPGLLMIWDRFAVFRVEAGFSREGGAVYLQSEHAF